MTDASARTAADAFIEDLFARHQGEIYAYLYRMVRDPELAADMTQDAFVKAYRNHASLEDPTHARAWLYQIAHRVALDEFRRRKIVRFMPWTGESHGSAPSAEHLAMDARLSAPLQRALDRIPERQRAALLLAELHDLTGLELAAALGVSHVAARALLTRARESLRQALAAEREAEAEAEARDAAGPGDATDGSIRDGPLIGPSPQRPADARTSVPVSSPRTASMARSTPRTRSGSTTTWPAATSAGRSLPHTPPTGSSCAAMPMPEPPRDLWARTSVAIERERSGRPNALVTAPRLRVRWQAVAGTMAILLVGVVAGRALLPPTNPGVAISGSATPDGGSSADATPLAVAPGDIAWAAPGANGSYTVNLANLDAVCPDNAANGPDCAPFEAGAKAIGSLNSRPGQVVLAPEAGQAAVVDASAATTGGSIMVVPIDRPTPSPAASGGPTTAPPTAKPTPTATASGTAHPSASPTTGTPGSSASPSPTSEATASGRPSASPTAIASASPTPTESPTGSPVATDTPEPTATATALAIIEDVIVVGGDAAYSADGEWLAFSARPADGSTGPDVFVWHVGDDRARPLTDDHQTVFSTWVDGKILASRAAPAGDAPAAGESPDPEHQVPISIQLDPATGKQRGSDLLGLWRPVVDPTGRWVVYWTGSLSLDADDPHAPARRRPPGHRSVGCRSRRRAGRDLRLAAARRRQERRPDP